jgi:predicted aldo/keto reductase-like oxidoreductase
MKMKRLGRTELMVSEIGCGGVPIERLPFDEAVDVVRYCYDRGMNIFDTGHAYGDSEDKIGAALEDVRDKVVLATKSLAQSADKIYKHVNHSLERLRTSYIDIYQFHNIGDMAGLERILSPGGAYEGLQKAKDERKIRFISLSSHNNDVAIKACKTGLFDTLQIAFNFIEVEPADEVFKVCEEMDMGILGMKPLGGGRLERPDLCFPFLQQYPQIVPIPGIETRKEADEILELYVSPRSLSESNWDDIKAIREELGDEFCHRCGYCMPCSKKVQIPFVLVYQSVKKLWAPDLVISFLKEAMDSVDECTECGECIKKCPYDLPIPDLLSNTKEEYDDFVKKHG